jgi:signal transduction histidine kinase
MNFHTAFFTMVTSQGLGLIAAAQLLVDPANTWLSWPVVLGILGLAIVSTTKVVRFVDEVRRDIKERADLAAVELVKVEVADLKAGLEKLAADEERERMSDEIRTLQQQVLRLEAHGRGVPPPDEMTGFGA